jgi:predicted HTH domain antitoxin
MTVQLELEEDLIDLLRPGKRPVEETARELIVLELYRQGLISGGRAAELLGKSRLEFVRDAAELRIPYFRMDEQEWEAAAKVTASPRP